MRFQPKTEREIAEEGLLPKGEYPYEVISAEEKKSKSGNDMIAVKLRIFAGENGGIVITDYLMEAMARKLRNFCAQNGLMAQYDAGTLRATDCEGKSGIAYVKIETDKTGAYPDKNAVADYLMEAMARKLRNFCAQNGLMAQYDAGTLRATDCEGKSGIAYVKIETDKTGAYPDKNAVADYPVKRPGAAQSGGLPEAAGGGITDDDVPFMRYDVPCL